MTRHVMIELTPEEEAYFDACARVRDITVTSLIRRVVRVLAADQIIGGVLDDAEHLRKRGPGEHRYRPGTFAPPA